MPATSAGFLADGSGDAWSGGGLSVEPLFIGSGVCWVGALLAWLGYRSSARRYYEIREIPTIAARDIPGLGAAMVELKGVTQVAEPLISDLARVPCVAFTCDVTEHWTTTRTKRDSKGNTRTVTEHHSQTLYSNSGQIPFEVRDTNGAATVRPDGASIDMLDTMVELDGPRPDSPACDISPHHWNGHLTYSESALPVDCSVYVLGEVGEDNAIGRPTVNNHPFIITYRTEEQLLSRAAWGCRIWGILAVLLFLAGFVALGVAFTNQRM